MTNYEIKKILDNYYQTYGADSIKKYWFKNYNDNMLSEEDWGLTTSSASGHSNSFGNAAECYGFSLFLAYLLTGKKLLYGNLQYGSDGENISGWILHKSNLTSITLEPGDIIRSMGHSAVVRENLGSTVKVVESLGSCQCEMGWGYFNAKNSNPYSSEYILSQAEYIAKAPKTNSSHKIKSAATGRYLRVNGSAVSGARVIQDVGGSSGHYRWIINTDIERECAIRSKADVLLGFRYSSDSRSYCKIFEVGTTSYDARITLEPSGANYRLKLTNHDLYLSADASGSNVYWASGDGSAYQLWTLEEV